MDDSVCPACDSRDRYRWPVKVLADRDHESVTFEPVRDVSVKWLVSQLRPGGDQATHPWDQRVSDLERQVFRVRARLRRIYPFGDRDVHLDLVDPSDPSLQMIAEVIDPECYRLCSAESATSKALIARFLRARQALLTASFYRPEIDLHEVSGGVTVTVTGVGFFDGVSRGLIGARNRIELHPVLDLTIH